MRRFLVLSGLLILLASCSQEVTSQNTPPATPSAPALVKAVAILKPTAGNQAAGTVSFEQLKDTTQVKVDLTGLTPGAHGFHIHEKGDCSSKDANSAGGHYNPTQKPHGAATANANERHIGDLGNLTANANGKATVTLKDPLLRLSGENSIVNRAVIVHAKADDLKSQPAGNAGGRVACGVIAIAKS